MRMEEELTTYKWTFYNLSSKKGDEIQRSIPEKFVIVGFRISE